MNRVRRAFGGLMWNYAAKLADTVGSYLIHIILARALGVAQYGVFAFLMSTAHLLLTASSLGFETALNRHVPMLVSGAGRGEPAVRFLVRRVLLYKSLMLCLVAIVALAGLSLSSSFPDAPVTGPLLLLGFVVARALIQTLGVVLTAQLETGITAKVTFLVRLLELVGVSLLALWGVKIHVLFGYLMLTGMLHVVLYGVNFRPPLRGPVERFPLRPFLAFSGIFFLNMLADFMLARSGDILFLTKLLPDTRQAGLYGAAAGLVYAAGMVATMGLAGVTLALFSGITQEGEGSAEKTRRFYLVAVRLVSALTIPIFAFLLVNAGSVVMVLFGQGYAGAILLVQALAGFRIATRLFGGGENAEMLLAAGKVKIVSLCGVSAALVNIAGDIALIPHFQAQGAVLASGTANLLVTMATGFMVWKVSGAALQPWFHLRLLAACLLAAFAASLYLNVVPILQLAVQLVGYLLLAGGMMIILKPFQDEDLRLVGQVRPGMVRFARLLVRP